MSFFAELKCRNAFRIGAAYILFGWVALQGADFALDLIGAPNWVIQALTVTVAAVYLLVDKLLLQRPEWENP